MEKSVEIEKIAEALAKAQGAMKTPDKNKTAKYPTKAGGNVQYNYADLTEIINCCRTALSQNGLAHVFVLEQDKLTLTLLHSSGQWLSSSTVLPHSQDIKQFGANLTYLRRYMLSCVLDLHADEDMDSEPEEGGKYFDRGKSTPPAKEMGRSAVTSTPAPSPTRPKPGITSVVGKPVPGLVTPPKHVTDKIPDFDEDLPF